MNILNITIIESSGADTLLMEVNLPNGEYPYNGNAAVKMTVAHLTAEEYCKRNFPNVPLEIVRKSNAG